MSASPSVDRLEHTEQWRVRTFELDSNGHVNNAVYLNYA
jgi:acyl-ACP thioesterase